MSDARALLLEIGCEELPPRDLERLATALADSLDHALASDHFIARAGSATHFASPRRLAVRVPDVAARQPDQIVERFGPTLASAFDDNGAPTRAAQGFARSLGVEPDQLERASTDKGERLVYRFEQPGAGLETWLQEALPRVVAELPVSRPMRWGDHDYHFIRPVHWLLVLHGDMVVDVTLFGHAADRHTRGHRVHCPAPVAVQRAGVYEATLRDAAVLADTATRRASIAQQIQQLASGAGLAATPSPALLDEVACLVEWPVALLCRFDTDFLRIPAAALVSSLQEHQKCFPVRDGDGNLSNHFITIANLESRDVAAVRDGFERVIRPRLADARFFWDQDRNKPLIDYLPELERVTFQQQLGSLADKTRRVEALCREIAVATAADIEIAGRAAQLSRCDLVTLMVGEFPELQGTMGRYYALESGEQQAVANAIEEMYQPRYSGDAIAASPAGRALAVAERTDTLLGIFAAGLRPSGSKDPYALRRAASGLVRTLVEGDMGVDLQWLLNKGALQLSDTVEIEPRVSADVLEFVVERLTGYLRSERGLSGDAVRAVSKLGITAPLDFLRRACAANDFRNQDAAASLAAANKRAANLLGKASQAGAGAVDPGLFQEPAERDLHERLQATRGSVHTAVAVADYGAALDRLAELRQPVDRFFDEVLVMADDERLQHNRLALLAELHALFLSIADVAELDLGETG